MSFSKMLTFCVFIYTLHSHQEKCKYELITGQWKTSHEVVAIYSDLLTSHSGLMGYIDPLHHKVCIQVQCM